MPDKSRAQRGRPTSTVTALLGNSSRDQSGLRAQCSRPVRESGRHFLWHSQVPCKPGILYTTSGLHLLCGVFRRAGILQLALGRHLKDLKTCWRPERGALTCMVFPTPPPPCPKGIHTTPCWNCPSTRLCLQTSSLRCWHSNPPLGEMPWSPEP